MSAMEFIVIAVAVAVVFANRGRRGITFAISVVLFGGGFVLNSTMLLSFGAAILLLASIEGVFARHGHMRNAVLLALTASLLIVFVFYGGERSLSVKQVHEPAPYDSIAEQGQRHANGPKHIFAERKTTIMSSPLDSNAT